MEEENVLDLSKWILTLVPRTRGRMKLQIKLGKEEALAFKNFTEMVKPPDIDEQDFLKGIFKIGIETMEMRLMEAIKGHAEENNIDLSSVGLAEELDTSAATS
jgi:hypothetical protein